MSMTRRLTPGKKLLVVVVMVLAAGLFFAQPQEAVLAQSTDQACIAIGGCDDDGESDIQRIIELMVNIFSIVIGIVATIMIMVGGYRYITSGGDSSKTASAKNTIIYAIIGLVIVALAQFLVHFVLSSLIGSDD